MNTHTHTTGAEKLPCQRLVGFWGGLGCEWGAHDHGAVILNPN